MEIELDANPLVDGRKEQKHHGGRRGGADQPPTTPVRQRESERNGGERQVTAPRKAEQRGNDRDRKYHAGHDPLAAVVRVQRDAAGERYQRHEEQGDIVGVRVDGDRAGHPRADGAEPNRVQDDHRVGDPNDHAGRRETCHDKRRDAPGAHDLGQHEEEGNGFDQVGAVDAEGSPAVRRHHHVDGARKQKDKRGHREWSQEPGHHPRAPALENERGDREHDGVLEHGRWVEADAPAQRVSGRKRTRERAQHRRDRISAEGDAGPRPRHGSRRR